MTPGMRFTIGAIVATLLAFADGAWWYDRGYKAGLEKGKRCQ